MLAWILAEEGEGEHTEDRHYIVERWMLTQNGSPAENGTSTPNMTRPQNGAPIQDAVPTQIVAPVKIKVEEVDNESTVEDFDGAELNDEAGKKTARVDDTWTFGILHYLSAVVYYMKNRFNFVLRNVQRQVVCQSLQIQFRLQLYQVFISFNAIFSSLHY